MTYLRNARNRCRPGCRSSKSAASDTQGQWTSFRPLSVRGPHEIERKAPGALS